MEPAERVRRCVVCHASYRDATRFCPLDGGAIVERVDAEADPFVGRTIDGRYLVHRRIGRGGMGVVYEAAHIGLDKRVALKFLLGAQQDPDALARFRREARVASKIDHPNVVNILDVGRDETGVDYLAMELVAGRDLQHLLASEGTLEPARAIGIVRQLLHGLAAIHDAGIVHRDLKPSNVIVVDELAKIMDFGISKAVAAVTVDQVTETGAVIGTPQYMSPEQLLGEALDPRSDLFSAGLILFTLLAGEPPFQDNTVSRLAAIHATQDIPSVATRRSELPVALVEVVAKAVARRPEDRYATAADFERALATIDLAGPRAIADRWQLRTANVTAATRRERPAEVPAPAPVSPASASPSPGRGRRWLVAAAIAGVGVAGVVYATREPPVEPVAPHVGSSSPGSAVVRPGSGSTVVAPPLDQRELARRADADGKLELAIALYADLAVGSPSPDLLFRLGELYERTGDTAKAATSFTRYLELSPGAPDRDHVRARIGRLQTGKPPAKPPAVAAKPPSIVASKVDLGPALRCYCFPGHGTDATHARLCRGLTTAPVRCTCRDEPAMRWLCSKPGTVCESSEPGCYDLLRCNDPGWGDGGTSVAKSGEPCSGYRETSQVFSGKYKCLHCDGTLGLTFEGHPGEPCVGYDWATGNRIDGHLESCKRK